QSHGRSDANMARHQLVERAPRPARKNRALTVGLSLVAAGAFVVGASGQSERRAPAPAGMEVAQRIQAEMAAAAAGGGGVARGGGVPGGGAGEPGFGPCRTYTTAEDFSEGHLFNL